MNVWLTATWKQKKPVIYSMDIDSGATTKHFSKGAILLHQGEYATSGYRVVSGCLKSYIIGNNGKEHILQFAPEGWIISDMDGIINKKPSNIFIDAIENTEVLLINNPMISELATLDSSFFPQMVTTLMRNVIATNRRLVSLLSASGKERYLEFTNTYPGLVQRLPLKLISSYIGVTPEYLSEIRRKLAHKQKASW